MKGLCEGFWPFDDGEWKIEVEEIVKNYLMDPEDIEQVHVFRDRKIAAGRWSDSLPDTDLLPSMKVSPIFIIWQHGKPQVVTDHASLGINDKIPQADGKIKYDDMCSFGQTLYNARAANPSKCIITFF